MASKKKAKQKRLSLKEVIMQNVVQDIDDTGKFTVFRCNMDDMFGKCNYYQAKLVPGNFKRHILALHPEQAKIVFAGLQCDGDDNSAMQEENASCASCPKHKKNSRSYNFRNISWTLADVLRSVVKDNLTTEENQPRYECDIRTDGKPCNFATDNFVAANFKRHIILYHPIEAKQLGFEVIYPNSENDSSTEDTSLSVVATERMKSDVAHSSNQNSSSSTIGTCCIPGCINDNPEWTTTFPRSEELITLWKSAIQAGTGQELSNDIIYRGARVCNMHFYSKSLSQSKTIKQEDVYREPTLFTMNNILTQVSRCCLCLRYEIVESMFSTDACLEQGYSLQAMISNYFGFLKNTCRTAKRWLCELCVVHIDVTHAFWRDITKTSKRYENLINLMANEKIRFTHSSNSWIQDACRKWEQIAPSLCIDLSSEGENEGDTLQHTDSVIVKEEPQLSETPPLCAEPIMCIKTELTIDEYSNGEVQTSGKRTHVSDLEIKAAFTNGNKMEEDGVESIASSQKQFKCYICDIFLSSHELRTHLTTVHQAQQNYLCSICQLPFDNITLFNTHLSTHRTKQFFKCRYCSMSFKTKISKWKHERIAHGKGNAFQPAVQRRKIDHNTLRRRRMNRINATTRVELCNLCGARMPSEKMLIKHKQIRHGIIASDTSVK